MKKTKKVWKTILKIVGIIFALCLVGIIAAVIYFWPFISNVDWSIVNSGNIKALYVAFTRDTDTLAKEQKEVDDKRAEDIKNYVSVDIRDFTEEELAQIESGERTKTEIVAEIIAESFNKGTDENVENSDENSLENPNAETTVSADEILSKHVSNLYSIQSTFEGRVSNLAVNARNWLHAYKNSTGVSWKEAKVAALKHFTSTASAIENDCYAQVDAELAALEADLKAIGADTSIVATVRESAYNEMDIKKAKIVQEGTAKMNKN